MSCAGSSREIGTSDNPNVAVVTGSIPPNKSDLTRFYEASEFANNSNFLYLAWERTNNLGSANTDFEINQKTQPDLTTAGQKTLNRTAGDLLVTFDFTSGGGRPTLSLLRWLTGATTPALPGFPTNACLSANSFPCWGDQITLNSSNSIGAVNNLDAVTDSFAPGGANNIGTLRSTTSRSPTSPPPPRLKCPGPRIPPSAALTRARLTSARPKGPGSSVNVTVNGLKPGTYTCTIAVDL